MIANNIERTCNLDEIMMRPGFFELFEESAADVKKL